MQVAGELGVTGLIPGDAGEEALKRRTCALLVERRVQATPEQQRRGALLSLLNGRGFEGLNIPSMRPRRAAELARSAQAQGASAVLAVRASRGAKWRRKLVGFGDPWSVERGVELKGWSMKAVLGVSALVDNVLAHGLVQRPGESSIPATKRMR